MSSIKLTSHIPYHIQLEINRDVLRVDFDGARNIQLIAPFNVNLQRKTNRSRDNHDVYINCKNDLTLI